MAAATTTTTTASDTLPFTLHGPLPPAGSTLYMCLDIEADGAAWDHHVPAFTIHIGDKTGEYPLIVSETFIFQEPPEGTTKPMDYMTRKTFWEKPANAELRKFLDARAKPFHEELDRFLRCWDIWTTEMFSSDKYHLQLPSDNGLFDWGRVSHMAHVWRRRQYPLRHFGRDLMAPSPEEMKQLPPGTNVAPLYHNIWDPSDPWWMLGLQDLIDPFLARYHGAAPTHNPADDANHMYWQAVYWQAVCEALSKSQQLRIEVAAAVYGKLENLFLCCICNKICKHEPWMRTNGMSMCQTWGCLASFCEEHDPLRNNPGAEIICPYCERKRSHCLECDAEAPTSSGVQLDRCEHCKGYICPLHFGSAVNSRNEMCKMCFDIVRDERRAPTVKK